MNTGNMVNQISVKAPETPDLKKRLEYVDIAKFIGIVCMVYGHSGLPEVLQQYIHIFHMPLFFILSGYTFDLFKHLKDPLRFFISRVKMILLPYMVFSLLIYLMRFCLSLKGIGSCIGFSDFLKILFNTCATDSFGGTVQWYLVCIFFTELISFTVMLLISRLSRRENISSMTISVVMVIFAIIGYAWYPITQIRLPMVIDAAFTGIVFYYIGFLFRRYNVISKMQKYKICLFNSFCIASVIGLLTTYISMRELIFGNPIIFYFDAVAISLSILGVSDKIASTEHSSFVYRWILLSRKKYAVDFNIQSHCHIRLEYY